MPENQSQAKHILELSRELLDDIELSRLPAESLLLKCSRLARLAGSDEVRAWIGFEMGGYNSTDPVSLKYMTLTGRWTDYVEKKGHWGPLAQQEAKISAQKMKIQSLKLPSVSGEFSNLSVNNIMRAITTASSNVSALSGIPSRVMALLHTFVAEVYYEREFAALAADVFGGYQSEIDALIGATAGDVLQKIPAVVERLQDGEEESVSQALTTCRRILDAFADAVYPPTDATITLDGNTLSLDAGKHQNRISAYIAERTESKSRRKRLRQNLSNLYDRVSTGVHKDVGTEEAYALFLNVYLFLGEALQLTKAAAATESTYDAA